MKRMGGIWLIFLIVGMSLSMAVSSKPVMAVSNDPYQAFWEILNREAELVVQFNETGNASLAVELIQNSLLGAENAANISALIWESLNELKTSGIKTYYTAQELREMAQNISQNGLPEETVQALKSQGWTDEQIQALEDYIAQNADNINEDFNMTAFLEDFSMAFIDVAFKYNHYESWTLEKWKWSQPAEPPQATNNEMVNPILAKEWVEFYRAYLSGDYNDMKSKVYRLKGSMYKLLSNEKRNCTLTFLRDGNLVTQRGIIQGINHTTNGSLVFTTLVTSSKGKYIIWNVTTYYWPDALYAYELSSNILALVTAMESGNENDELVSILNQKVAELKDTMKVLIIENKVLKNPIRDDPIRPIEPIYPINPKLPAQPVSTISTKESTTSLQYPTSTITITPADDVTATALEPNDGDGRLVIDSVGVEVVEVTSDHATYRVVVHIHAEDNAVSNVNVEFRGTKLSDSQSVGFLYPGDSLIVKSAVSGKVYGSGQVTVSGTVKITYTPSSGPTPNSVGPANDEREITKSYSKTITLEDNFDPGKIHISIGTHDENGDGVITAGEDVTFKVVVENDNSANVSGSCRIDVVYPISSSDKSNQSFNVDVSVPTDGNVEKTFGIVHYAWSGTFTYTGECSFDQYTKSFSGYVTVEDGDSTDPVVVKTINVVPVTWPSTARLGDSVEFNVDLENMYSIDKSVKIELKVDGVTVDFAETTIIAGRVTSVILNWNVPHDFTVGDHIIKIQAFSRNPNSNDPWNPEDSETDSIEIKGVEILNVDCPQRAGLGETIECRIYLKNTLDDRVGTNTKQVILIGYPYDEYLHETRTVSIEYPIQDSINIDPDHTEILLVAPIEIPDDRKILDYRYTCDQIAGDCSFEWADTNYTLQIKLDMPYPQEDITINRILTLYYFGSSAMQEISGGLVTEYGVPAATAGLTGLLLAAAGFSAFATFGLSLAVGAIVYVILKETS
ncbi:hypothetical protein [Thermococcus sp. ES12]|uniref:hypothetical protein n=1 Tax=Thermococcus sp. ES12 TaxID=1638246 RepID=UPI001430E396|nr:hypothetical protein [Thermococcus sp. ES12]NJE76756.1 hypothetical protein [Thermococcus sp. ES12]